MITDLKTTKQQSDSVQARQGNRKSVAQSDLEAWLSPWKPDDDKEGDRCLSAHSTVQACQSSQALLRKLL